MVRGAFTTPISTMAEHREWPLGNTSAATSPCSTMKDRDGGGRRREREAQAHLHACKRTRITPALALPTGADLYLVQSSMLVWLQRGATPAQGGEPAWRVNPVAEASAALAGVWNGTLYLARAACSTSTFREIMN